VSQFRHPRAAKVTQYAILTCYVLFLGFPLLWLLSVAFKGPRELVELHPSLIPDAPTFDNFRDPILRDEVVTAGLNSLKVAVATAALATIVSLPSAYVLARTRGVITRMGIAWILLSQMFPLILTIVPLFLLLRDFHLTNTHTGLVLVYLVWALPFTLWMLQGYVRGIPKELEEAAATDGATRLQIIVRLIAPLLLPGIVVTLIFSFILAWNEFFLALVLLQSPELKTLPVLLAQFVGIEGVPRLGPLAAASLLATLPSLVFFAIVQRWLTGGLLRGAVKG
jgi:multiple sugar transport system permease protein